MVLLCLYSTSLCWNQYINVKLLLWVTIGGRKKNKLKHFRAYSCLTDRGLQVLYFALPDPRPWCRPPRRGPPTRPARDDPQPQGLQRAAPATWGWAVDVVECDKVNMTFGSCQLMLDLHVLMPWTFCCCNETHRSVLGWTTPLRITVSLPYASVILAKIL